ncbi:MAG: radical SAM protein [Nitrospirae bacterium]|nr:radical SAM protein [Nitrospirota bacterium]
MRTFPPPQFIQLYPTIRCNQSCSFCFNASVEYRKDLTPEDALNLLDIMMDLGIHNLDIMGGEPFLLHWMPSFIHEAVNRGIVVNVSTNGSLPEVMEAFRGLNHEKINIGISLEGSTAHTHNGLTSAAHFERAVSSISTLVSMGLNPVVKTVVTKATLPDIQPIIHLLHTMGVKRYYLIHMDLLSKNDSSHQSAISYPDFLDFYYAVRSANRTLEINRVNASCFEKGSLAKGVRCAGGVRKLAVMPDGSVYPCNLFLHAPEFNLGNIFTDKFTTIWSSPKLRYFRTFGGNSCRLKACSNYASCTGGCPAHAFFHGRGLQGTDIRCTDRTIP